jgi:hypothetical protein
MVGDRPQAVRHALKERHLPHGDNQETEGEAMPKVKKTGSSDVTLVCAAGAGVQKVFLAGDFNGWDPTATRMVKNKGAFRKRMDLPPGEHQYKFVVDGEWQIDPSAAAQVSDGHGGMNSIVRV